MQLDDLDGLEEPGSLRGEPHHGEAASAITSAIRQHFPDGYVRPPTSPI